MRHLSASQGSGWRTLEEEQDDGGRAARAGRAPVACRPVAPSPDPYGSVFFAQSGKVGGDAVRAWRGPNY